MNLTVRIHDKEYTQEVAQGTTFTEEYNETLDSGTVRLSHIKGQITGLRPYDDVYIYESGYDFDTNIAKWQNGGEQKDSPFYRHLLVDQFSEDVINLSENIFSYTIELFSETKGLEAVQCPNISVTQPLKIIKKIDIYTYLVRFVNLYSPKIKTMDRKNPGCWTYTSRYSVSPELKEIFSGYYSQDFTLSNPTLRDVLSTLMITRDMIPYVKDNVIYAKAISERTKTPWGEFSYDIAALQKNGMISRIAGQMTSSDYCDGVRRQYSDALSQDGICNFIEYLGFRNQGNALMTLENMRLETLHKIYKVEKMYMCYYKKAYIRNIKNELLDTVWFFCKQDITPLVKNQAEWGVLSQDWRELDSPVPKNLEELSHYKMTTVYYSIGGNTIEGWGIKYQKYQDSMNPFVVYDITKTYIENILEFVDKYNRMGSVSQEDLIKFYKEKYSKDGDIYVFPTLINSGAGKDNLFSPMKNASYPQKMKTIFFEIEYTGFYDGALIHSRDNGRDNIYQNDNVSASLTLLEKDGASQKEKLNRFANKTYVMNGRLEGVNYGVQNLLRLGNTGAIGADDDVIIYRRQYSIFDNYISVSYAGIQDYVLKNFYTSVYAKYRTNQLMSYGESTNRSESNKVILLLSKDKKIKDEKTLFKISDANGNRIESKKIFSAFSPNNESERINTAVITAGTKKYYVDEHTFTSGNMLCFNMAMGDNASGGNYIENWKSDFQLLAYDPSEGSDYYVGTKQKWYDIVDNDETGAVSRIRFEISSTSITPSLVLKDNQPQGIYDFSKNLPRLTAPSLETVEIKEKNKMSLDNDFIHKDNKERINMTMQIEPISTSQNDIVIGDYFLKLSDLAAYNGIKCDTDIIVDKSYYAFSMNIVFDFKPTSASDLYIMVKSTENNLFEIYKALVANNNDVNVNFSFNFSNKDNNGLEQGVVFEAKKIRYEGTKIYGTDRVVAEKLILTGTGVYGTWSEEQQQFIEKSLLEIELILTGDSVYTATIVAAQLPNDNPIQSICECLLKTKKSSTVERNMFVQFNKKPINKTDAYKILPCTISKSNTFAKKEGVSLDEDPYIKPTEIFHIVGDGDESKIVVDLTNVPSGIRSITYWYFDFKSAYTYDYTDDDYVYTATPSQSGYYFVFGVNITEEDIDRGQVDIYVSKTTNRDERVFDTVGRQIGVIHNCIDKDGNYVPPTKQAYDTVNNVKIGKITFVNNIGVKGWIATKGDYYYAESETIEASIDKLSDAAQITGKVGWTDENGNIYDTWELEYISDGNDHTFTAGIISD